MQVTSDQIRAARMILRWNQSNLRVRAGVPYATVKSAERPEEIGHVSIADLDPIRSTLEEAGIRFIPHGVQRPPALTPEQQARFELLEDISRRSAELLKGTQPWTDDDLYDENGLPA